MDLLNPAAGGGLSNAKLQLANAAASDVLSGKKFYSKDKTLKTGTFSLAATATPEDVVSGKTFYSGSKMLKTGTRSPGTLREASGTFTFPYNADAAINVGFQPKYVMLWGFSGERSLVYLCGSGVNDGAAILDRYGQGYGSNNGVSITSTGFKANYRIGSSSISSYFQNTTVNYVAIG